MENPSSPKKLQKAGEFDRALQYYVKRYRDCLEEGDSFLSGHYLDEIAQTLIGASERTLPFRELEHGLAKSIRLDSLEGRAAEQASLDLQVSLRKRFPGQFKDTLLEDR